MTRKRNIFSAAMPLGGLLLLGACSSIPDAANPAQWYRSTVDYFSGDDKEAEQNKRAAERQRQAQAAQAQAQAQAQTQTSAQAAPAQPALASETSDVAERIARPAGRGLLADTGGGQPRYAAAVPRQTEDPGPPGTRAATAPTTTAAATAERPTAPAPRPPVSAAAPPAPATDAAAASPRTAREIAQAPPPRPPASATAPPPPVAQVAPPARPASVEETYRASLVQQNQLPSAVAQDRADDPGTVIISSEGIEAPRRAAPPSAGIAAQPSAQAFSAGEGRRFLGPALRPAGTVEGSAAARAERATKIATIQFADGSAWLDEEARQVLGQVAKLLSENGGTVRVVGHASLRTKPMDPERYVKVNEGISIARANAVAGQLTRLGVKREAIVINALGGADPAYYEIMETGEAGNRRVEIYLGF